MDSKRLMAKQFSLAKVLGEANSKGNRLFRKLLIDVAFSNSLPGPVQV